MKQRINLIITFLAIFVVCDNMMAQQSAINEADLHIRQGDYQLAVDRLTEHIDIRPADAHAYLKRAVAYEILGQREDKERDLQYANYLNPFAYMYISSETRSDVYAKKKYSYNFDGGSENYTKSPVINEYYKVYLEDRLHIHDQDSLLEQAIYYLSKSDLTNTEKTLASIKETDNISGILYDLKGIIELKNNRLPAAIDYFTQSIAKMPNFPLAYHNRAIAYKLQGDYDKSKSDLEKAISLNEDISVFYFTLAKLSERLDNPSEAIYNYKEAININPDYREARINYSVLQKTLGNYDEAMSQMNVITNSGDSPNNHFINGGIHLTYGEYENAIEEFNKYLIKNTNDSDAIFNRGLSKILSGYKKEGCDDIYRSIEIKSNEKRTEILDSFCPNY